jgi:hypothetical protein
LWNEGVPKLFGSGTDTAVALPAVDYPSIYNVLQQAIAPRLLQAHRYQEGLEI